MEKASQYKQVNSKGTTYYLNTREVTLHGGRVQRIYYFSKDGDRDTACDLPQGYVVIENPRNGLLIIKKG